MASSISFVVKSLWFSPICLPSMKRLFGQRRLSSGSPPDYSPSCKSPSKRRYSAGRRIAFHLEGATKLLHLPTEYLTQRTRAVVTWKVFCGSRCVARCFAKQILFTVLQFTFQRKILCRAQSRLPLGRCNKIAAPSNRIPHTAHQGVVGLEGVLQEVFIGKKLLINELSLGENYYLCWRSSH